MPYIEMGVVRNDYKHEPVETKTYKDVFEQRKRAEKDLDNNSNMLLGVVYDYVRLITEDDHNTIITRYSDKAFRHLYKNRKG